ncbi:MAG: GrpB family protein [Phycicoccus sp.]
MPTPHQIASFDDDCEPPAGAVPWVDGAGPSRVVEVVDPDPAWPGQFALLAARVRAALGSRVLSLDHIGSTSVPGLAAKPVIDLDLVVADPAEEATYVPELEAAGFVLVVREAWWWGHRLLRATDPTANLHVFGPDSPAPWRDRALRDWLRVDDDDRERYAAVKHAAARAATVSGEHVMDYNARKQPVLREIAHRAFVAAGLTRS